MMTTDTMPPAVAQPSSGLLASCVDVLALSSETLSLEDNDSAAFRAFDRVRRLAVELSRTDALADQSRCHRGGSWLSAAADPSYCHDLEDELGRLHIELEEEMQRLQKLLLR